MHNPEFSIVEWYRRGEDHRDAMARTERLVRAMMPGRFSADPFPVVRYWDAVADACGRRAEALDARGLSSLAVECGVDVSGPLDRDGWLNAILAEVVEPRLAAMSVVFVTDYPDTQSALAVVRDGDPPVAERFELYVGGVEVANGYHELTDADELRRRFVRQNELRVAAGKDPLPVDSRLLDAMRAGLPSCAGVAVGWDRVAMLALGLDDVREAMSFPVAEA